MLATPPPSTVEESVVDVAVKRLALMTLSLIVIPSNAAVMIAPAAACALHPKTSRWRCCR